MKFAAAAAAAACLLLASCAVVNPKTPVHSAVAPMMNSQFDAVSAAIDHLLAQADSPPTTDPDVVALAAPVDDAPAVVGSSRADWAPFIDVSKKWDPLLVSLAKRHKLDDATLLTVSVDYVAWMRAFVIAGRRINSVELGSADENAHHERGLLTVERGITATLVGVLLNECASNPGAAKAPTWAYLTAASTYAPLRASVLATFEKSIAQLAADPKGASCADELHTLATVVAQARDHAVAP